MANTPDHPDPRSSYERALFGMSYLIWLPIILAALALVSGALLGP